MRNVTLLKGKHGEAVQYCGRFWACEALTGYKKSVFGMFFSRLKRKSQLSYCMRVREREEAREELHSGWWFDMPAIDVALDRLWNYFFVGKLQVGSNRSKRQILELDGSCIWNRAVSLIAFFLLIFIYHRKTATALEYYCKFAALIAIFYSLLYTEALSVMMVTQLPLILAIGI